VASVSCQVGKEEHRTEVTEATEVWEKSKDDPNSLLVVSNPLSSLLIVIVVRVRSEASPLCLSIEVQVVSVSR
jgi:hypothetical protein